MLLRLTILFLLCMFPIEVNATETETISSEPIILDVGTHTIGSQTYIVSEKKWEKPITVELPILGKKYQTDLFYLPTINCYQAVLYFDDREIVAFFNQPTEWLNTILLKINKTILNEINKNVNFKIIDDSIEKLSIPQKENK